MNDKIMKPEIRFEEFDSEWKQHKLGDFLVITSASRVHKHQWTKSGVPFFRSSDVVSAYKGQENNKAFISVELFEELSNKSGRLQKNDLLVTGGGSIGIPYLVKTNEPLYSKDADLLWLKNGNITDGYFLYTFFSTSAFRRYVNSITHIGTISHYTVEQAKATPIRLPKKQEQNKIGTCLSKLDHLVSLHQSKFEKLTTTKRELLQKMLAQGNKNTPEIRFKGFEGAWKKHSWENTIDISTNMVDPKTGKYDHLFHVGPGNIESFSGRIHNNILKVKDSNLISGKFYFNKGDIIYGKINPQLAKYAIAPFEGLTSADAYVLNTKNGIKQDYLYIILQTSNFFKYSVSVSARTGMPKINRDELNTSLLTCHRFWGMRLS